MTELLAFAKGHGITVCLENMPMRSFSLSKPLQILKFVEAVDDENFQICLDTGHAALFSDLSVGDAVRALGNHLKVLHVHDNFGDQDSHLWPLSGVIDWTDFVRALTEIGFCGVFSLETAPSESLHDADFEAECVKLYRIAETLVGQK